MTQNQTTPKSNSNQLLLIALFILIPIQIIVVTAICRQMYLTGSTKDQFNDVVNDTSISRVLGKKKVDVKEFPQNYLVDPKLSLAETIEYRKEIGYIDDVVVNGKVEFRLLYLGQENNYAFNLSQFGGVCILSGFNEKSTYEELECGKDVESLTSTEGMLTSIYIVSDPESESTYYFVAENK